MPDISQIVPPKRVVATPQRMPARGVVSQPPTDLTALTMRVVIPSFTTEYDQECRWVRQGNALPTVGADCFVGFDENGAGIVVWWSIASPVDMATQAELDAAVAIESVTPVSTFTNSWVNFDTDRPAGFYKDRGRTYLTGLLKSGTVGSSAFTLPSGYRPASVNGLIFAVDSNGAFGVIVILSTGTVIPSSGSNVYFSLEGISFLHA